MTAEIHDVEEVLARGALDVRLLAVVVLQHVLDELIGEGGGLVAFWTPEQSPLVLPLLVLVQRVHGLDQLLAVGALARLWQRHLLARLPQLALLLLQLPLLEDAHLVVVFNVLHVHLLNARGAIDTRVLVLLLLDVLGEVLGILKVQVALQALEGPVEVGPFPVLHHCPLPAELLVAVWAFDEGADLGKIFGQLVILGVQS